MDQRIVINFGKVIFCGLALHFLDFYSIVLFAGFEVIESLLQSIYALRHCSEHYIRRIPRYTKEERALLKDLLRYVGCLECAGSNHCRFWIPVCRFRRPIRTVSVQYS